jgi:hypothetical protein
MSLILSLHSLQYNMTNIFKKESIITTFLFVGLLGVTNVITYYLCNVKNESTDSEKNVQVTQIDNEIDNEINSNESSMLVEDSKSTDSDNESSESSMLVEDSQRIEKLLDKRKELTEMLAYLEKIQESLDIIKSKLHKE